MPSAEIIDYTAHTGLLGSLGPECFIVLHHRSRDEGSTGKTTEGTSRVFFSDRFAAATTGYATIGAAASVSAYLPAAIYAHWIDLLRYEDPVYLHWTMAEEPGQADPEGIIHLSTGPEPPGEGPVDLSP